MKTRLLILVLALQCAWLLGTALVQERALREGTVIRLETRPVDPRDLLRGDYVILITGSARFRRFCFRRRRIT